MNSEEEIATAFTEFHAGAFGPADEPGSPTTAERIRRRRRSARPLR
ncbi:hypothetical protein [Streptomyces sp. NPDC057616]